jgi:DNA-binding CsgD family transcriptional regulator
VLLAYGAEREIRDIVYEPGSSNSNELEEIARAEHALHVFDAAGERVVRCRAPLGAYQHGLTIICGDDDWTAGLVVILRNERAGRFTDADVAELAALAPSISAYLARFAGRSAEAKLRLRARTQPAFFILNDALEIEHAWSPDGETPTVVRDGAVRLAPPFEAAVRDLTAQWAATDPATLHDGIAVPEPPFVLRVLPLFGSAGLRIGVSVERLKTRNAMRSAARKFGLSPRELEVLTLLLEGRDSKEAADVLHIAPSTVNDHVKRMLTKTQSRNRAELVARALGWNSEAG